MESPLRTHVCVCVCLCYRAYVYIFFPLFLQNLRRSDLLSGSATSGISSGRLRENYRGVILDEIVPTEKKQRGVPEVRTIGAHVDAPQAAISPCRSFSQQHTLCNPVLLRIAGSRMPLSVYLILESSERFNNSLIFLRHLSLDPNFFSLRTDNVVSRKSQNLSFLFLKNFSK